MTERDFADCDVNASKRTPLRGVLFVCIFSGTAVTFRRFGHVFYRVEQRQVQWHLVDGYCVLQGWRAPAGGRGGQRAPVDTDLLLSCFEDKFVLVADGTTEFSAPDANKHLIPARTVIKEVMLDDTPER